MIHGRIGRLKAAGRYCGSVESVHRGFRTLGDPDGDGLGGDDQGVIDQRAFGGAEPAEDVVGGVDRPSIADPDAEPGVVVGPEVGGDVAEAFLAPVATALADPELAQREVQVVAEDQEVGRLELVEAEGRGHAPAAEVHEGLGLQEQDAPVVDLDLGELPLELPRELRPRAARGEPVDGLEADVVAGPVVLAARVAEPHDQFEHPSGRPTRADRAAVTPLSPCARA